MNLIIMILLLAGLVISALACIMLRDLLKASVALAVVSGLLSIIMFLLRAPLAAVFELSVCTGLLTVVFISAVSMTKLRTKEELAERERSRRKRYAPLPVLLALLLAGSLVILWPHIDTMLSREKDPAETDTTANVFWNKRQADLLGEMIIVLAGVYGVLIFFKEDDKE